MQKIVIFGIGEIAELADFYFTHDSDLEVAGFTVDQAYVKDPMFRGRPLVSFENVTQSFPPSDFGFFVAVSYSKLNELRASRVAAARAAGYRLVSYVSSNATTFRGLEIRRTALFSRTIPSNPLRRSGPTSRCGAAIISVIIP